MNVYIITGASGGLGEALAMKLLGPANHVIGISRTKSTPLWEYAARFGYRISHIPCDLGSAWYEIENAIDEAFDLMVISEVQSMTLINNAATIEPVNLINKCRSQDVARAFTLNTLAPVILTARFIEKTTELAIEKCVINVSSKASEKLYMGLSSYSSAKAAVAQFTKSVANEQKKCMYPTKLMLFVPCSMNTAMQARMRKIDKAIFPHVQKFKKAKKDGKLQDTAQVADEMIRLLLNGKQLTTS